MPRNLFTIRNIVAGYRAHTEPIFKSLNLIKVQDIYYLAILKFYSKLINNNLPHYFDDFMPHFSIGATNYKIRNPDLQLPRIIHEFPRSSLRYQLMSTLNETSPEIMEMPKNCTQYIFINHVRKGIVDGYRDACDNPNNCYSCNSMTLSNVRTSISPTSISPYYASDIICISVSSLTMNVLLQDYIVRKLL